MKGRKPTLIILAAGASSRMKKSLEALQSEQKNNSSSTIPALSLNPGLSGHKGLIPLDDQGQTAIDLLLDQAHRAGITRVIMIIQPPGTSFKKHFEKSNPVIPENQKAPKTLKDKITEDKITIDFAYQKIPDGREKPLGTADALHQCLEQFPELLNEEFIVCNADNLYSKDAFLALINAPSENALIGYHRRGLNFPLAKIRNFALLVTNQQGCMTQLIEKPDEKITQSLSAQGQDLNVSMNLWKFKGSDIWPSLEQCPMHPERLEKELPAAVKLMITNHDIKLRVIPRNEHVPDLTQASDIGAVKHFLNQESKD